MQDILDAIARRADLVATFKRFEAMIPGVSSAELRPVIAASLELAQKLDLKADSKAIEGLNRVWTQYCEKSTEDGEFLYDAVLSAIESAVTTSDSLPVSSITSTASPVMLLIGISLA